LVAYDPALDDVNGRPEKIERENFENAPREEFENGKFAFSITEHESIS